MNQQITIVKFHFIANHLLGRKEGKTRKVVIESMVCCVSWSCLFNEVKES